MEPGIQVTPEVRKMLQARVTPVVRVALEMVGRVRLQAVEI